MQNCLNFVELNSDPASPSIFSIFQRLTPDISLCSAAKKLNAAVTDLVLLLDKPITLVNLEKAFNQNQESWKVTLWSKAIIRNSR